jgi:predicted O-methyltransferase YrrM
MGARRVLDIGTYVGTSALMYAMAVGHGGRVVSVDTDDVNGVGGHWHNVRGAVPPASLMKSADLAERVDFVRMDARDFLECTCDRFDLISLDGWHEDFAVEREIELSLDRLTPNGLIFLDDVQAANEELPAGFDRIDGPRVAVERLLRNGAPFRVVHLPRTLDGDWCAGAFLLAAEL